MSKLFVDSVNKVVYWGNQAITRPDFVVSIDEASCLRKLLNMACGDARFWVVDYEIDNIMPLDQLFKISIEVRNTYLSLNKDE